MKCTEKKGYKISRMTLGTVQLGLAYGINNTHGMPTYEESKGILRAAVNSGICCFDTARAYGESEAVLGRYFAEEPTDKTIVTKVRFDKESRSEVSASLFSQVEDSKNKLGLDKIPFLMLHREDYIDTYGKELTDALLELKRESVVANIGISFSDKSNMIRLLESDIFDCIQIPQNIFDNAELRTGMLKELDIRGIAVFIRSVYLQGLFFRDTDTLPQKLVCAKSALDKLHRLAEDNSISMSELALSFIRDAVGVTSLVLGCETTDQLYDSISKFDAPKLDEALRSKLMEISEEVDSIVTRPWEWK